MSGVVQLPKRKGPLLRRLFFGLFKSANADIRPELMNLAKALQVSLRLLLQMSRCDQLCPTALRVLAGSEFTRPQIIQLMFHVHSYSFTMRCCRYIFHHVPVSLDKRWVNRETIGNPIGNPSIFGFYR